MDIISLKLLSFKSYLERTVRSSGTEDLIPIGASKESKPPRKDYREHTEDTKPYSR